jgi:hypothetical protein
MFQTKSIFWQSVVVDSSYTWLVSSGWATPSMIDAICCLTVQGAQVSKATVVIVNVFSGENSVNFRVNDP